MFVVFAAILGDEPDPSVDETEVQRLVRAARSGNGGAARRLYTLHVGRLYRAVRGSCLSDAEAEDLVQETFVRALTSLAEYQYRPETRFIAWLTTVGMNVLRKRVRSRRVHAQAVPLLSERDANLGGPDLDDALDSARMRRRLVEVLSELPERERQVVTLRYGAGLTAPEVAAALDLSPANVRKICERQRQVLLEKLGLFGPGEARDGAHGG